MTELYPSQGDQVLSAVRDAIASIRFGSVEIVIHDSKVVQIERKEKVRFGINQNSATDRSTGSADKEKKENKRGPS